MRILNAARLTCLLPFYLFTAALAAEPIVDRLFTVHPTCAQVNTHFQDMVKSLRQSMRSYHALALSDAEVKTGLAAGLDRNEIKTTTNRNSELPMKHAHIMTGMSSFEMYGRQRECVFETRNLAVRHQAQAEHSLI